MTEKKTKGFGALSPERRTEIARMGQAAVASRGTRYKFTPEKAREAQKVGWARRNGHNADTVGA